MKNNNFLKVKLVLKVLMIVDKHLQRILLKKKKRLYISFVKNPNFLKDVYLNKLKLIKADNRCVFVKINGYCKRFHLKNSSRCVSHKSIKNKHDKAQDLYITSINLYKN